MPYGSLAPTALAADEREATGPSVPWPGLQANIPLHSSFCPNDNFSLLQPVSYYPKHSKQLFSHLIMANYLLPLLWSCHEEVPGPITTVTFARFI